MSDEEIIPPTLENSPEVQTKPPINPAVVDKALEGAAESGEEAQHDLSDKTDYKK